MSKSKSRQPSRQASAASKNRSSGAVRPASSAGKTTTEIAVDDSAANEETQASASTATTVKEVPSTPAPDKPARTAKLPTKEMPSTPVPAKPAARAATKAVPVTPARSAAPSSASSKGLSRDAAKYERRQAERQMRYLAERRRRRNIAFTITGIILVVLIIGGGVTYFVYQAHQPKSTTTTTNQAPYQEAIYNSSYPPVQSVYCDQLEQSVEHIHAYVMIYIDGKSSPLPQYVGIALDQSSGNPICYYWLHTHDSSGVIHIESPANEPFTFGQFLGIWNQQFNSLGFPSQLLLDTGWTMWVNGQPYHGTLDSIPLAAHNIITVAYNSPNVKPVTTYNWGSL